MIGPAGILAIAFAATLVARAMLARCYVRSRSSTPTALAPRVLTLAQPILSGDPLLENRLETNLLELADQAFLWMVDEDDPEGIRVARKLHEDHPGVDLRVVSCPPCPGATNPKLWKLRSAAALARTEKFVVLDDDTLLPRATAATLAASSGGRTVATALPFYEPAGKLPTALLAQFVDNNSAFTYLGTAYLRPPLTLNGMAYALDLGELHRLGDFTPIVHELTDDLAMATLVLREGGSIAQTAAPVFVRTSVPGFRTYLSLMHRWHVFTLLLIRRQGIGTRVLIFVLHGLPPILLTASIVLGLLRRNAIDLAAVLLLRSLVLAGTQRRVLGTTLHRPVASLASELLQPIHLVHALAVRTIRWRTRRYRVRDSDDFSAA